MARRTPDTTPAVPNVIAIYRLSRAAWQLRTAANGLETMLADHLSSTASLELRRTTRDAVIAIRAIAGTLNRTALIEQDATPDASTIDALLREELENGPGRSPV